MRDFAFGLPQNIYFGEGSLNLLPELVKKASAQSIFIISGPHLNKIGVVGKVETLLREAGCKVAAFTETEANPGVATVEKAAENFKAAKADCILALGGGSPMDVAKAVGVIAQYGGRITDYEGAGKVPGEIVPIIAVPTTAGTGSEVTSFSVITDHDRNYKLTICSDTLLPAYVILDIELLFSLPATIAAATGVDAMVHAIESYLSKAANPFTDCMAEKALALIGKNIRCFTADRSNREAAGAMLLGSTLAGIAFNHARLGNVHAMAHPVGGFFHVAHGIANAILLPVCLEFNALADSGKYKKIYKRITLYESGEKFYPAMLVSEIRKLTRSLGIPSSLTEVGVKAERIPEMAEDAMKSGNILVNPRNTTIKDIESLYYKAM